MCFVFLGGRAGRRPSTPAIVPPTNLLRNSITGIVHEIGKLVSNSQFWYGEYDYSLKLANFADSPFKGGCPSLDKSNRHRTSPTVVGQV